MDLPQVFRKDSYTCEEIEMSKVTFPHMGNLYISLKVLFDTIGIDYIMPPQCKKTLERGIIHSPEFACLPFKVTLGDFIYCMEHGADTIFFGGGCGQCRFGYYADLHAEILRSIGYDFDLIHLDSSNMTFNELIKKLKPLARSKNIFTIFKGILLAGKTVFAVDRLHRLASFVRCREVCKGETDRVITEFYNSVQVSSGYKDTNRLITLAGRRLGDIRIDYGVRPLKIAIVGEIYTTIDPYINLEIEKRLGNMGVEADNKLTISRWVMDHGIKKVIPIGFKNKAHETGKEFMDTDDIGGHGLQTIGNCILSARKKYDGVIQVYPFTCMPEIVAQSTFGELQKKYGIPVMSLVIDELTGEAGYLTRIEAFVDMLFRRRNIPGIYKAGIAEN